MVRSILLSVSAALLLAAASTTAMAATTHWEFVDANQPQTKEFQPACGKQLRGVYEDLSIYAVPEECIVKSSMLPAEHMYSQLIVLERQHREGDTPQDILDWNNSVQEAVADFATDDLVEESTSKQLPYSIFRGRRNKNLKHRKSLQAVVDQVDVKTLEQDVTWLSGEANGSPFITRSSTSKQSIEVAEWLKSQFESYGCDTVELMSYQTRFGPNVICTFKGTEYPDEHVILGAHHDSRGSFLNPRAPGADDDGSGTTMLLQVARIIKANNLTFGRTFIISAFSGEEQGLFGSAALAKKLKSQGTTITMMVQGDMLAYRKPGEPIQVAFPARYHTAELSSLLHNVTELYVPEAVVGITGACCSDHQSFWEAGYPATAFFERNGPIADPKYHNSGDLVYREGYDFAQLRASTQAMLASVFEVAEAKLK
ncbi:hypothetical protein BGZ91_006380 [Linnemannia elongata]|nr:hypothetical protein BGZ91_006380 [Linnemannia elongata]